MYSIISVLMLQKIMEIRGLGFSFSVLNMTGAVTFNFLSKFYTWEFQLVKLKTANFSHLFSTHLFLQGPVHAKLFCTEGQEKSR